MHSMLWEYSSTFIATAAPMRANVWAMRAMSAPVAQPHHRARIDAVEQDAGFARREHRGFAFFHDMLGATHRVRRIHIHDMADDRPVEEHPKAARCFLTVGLESVCSPSMNAATLRGSTVARSTKVRPSHQSENLHAAL
jgi:hypothetical protein